MSSARSAFIVNISSSSSQNHQQHHHQDYTLTSLHTEQNNTHKKKASAQTHATPLRTRSVRFVHRFLKPINLRAPRKQVDRQRGKAIQHTYVYIFAFFPYIFAVYNVLIMSEIYFFATAAESGQLPRLATVAKALRARI